MKLKEKILEIENNLIELTLKIDENFENKNLDKEDLKSLFELTKSYSEVIFIIKGSFEKNKIEETTSDFINEKITDAENFIEGALKFLK
ncbi:MAG: hypothetical protein CL760_07025 [Chloroflexi bacterium]|nr:hypothetical protein [Chloroflexota bacterium]